MELLLLWLLVNVLTWAAGRLKISKTYVALGLSVIGGWIYFYFTNYNPEFTNIGWVYASSQVIFNIFKKLGILDAIEK